MKKFIAFLLVFCLAIPQAFAQISFWSSKIENKLVWTEVAPQSPRQVLFQRTVPLVGGVLTQSLQSPKKTIITLGAISIGTTIIYTSLTNYLKSSRDISRSTKLRSIVLALTSYQVDRGAFPPKVPNGCVPYGYLIVGAWYISRTSDFSEPKPNFRHNGCSEPKAKAPFAYRVIKKQNKEKIILSANMELSKNGNSPYSIDELVANPKFLEEVESGKYNKKGKYYIIIN